MKAPAGDPGARSGEKGYIPTVKVVRWAKEQVYPPIFQRAIERENVDLFRKSRMAATCRLTVDISDPVMRGAIAVEMAARKLLSFHRLVRKEIFTGRKRRLISR